MSGWDDNDELKAALPKVPQSNGGTQTSDAATEHRNAPTENWGEKTQNNYDENNENVSWEGNARVYEWDGEAGDLGPEHPELESQLFGDPNLRDPQGIDFSKYVVAVWDILHALLLLICLGSTRSTSSKRAFSAYSPSVLSRALACTQLCFEMLSCVATKPQLRSSDIASRPSRWDMTCLRSHRPVSIRFYFRLSYRLATVADI